MTTRKKPAAKGKAAARKPRVKRETPARSGPIRTGSHLPKDEPDLAEPLHSGKGPVRNPAEGMSPQAHANADLDEGMINQAVADAVRNANDVLTQTVAQGRVAAANFRHGEYNMRDVPVDVEIMGLRMIKLARELGDTALNIIEQILRQTTKVPPSPQPGQKGSVPPFPTGRGNKRQAPGGSDQAPPSSNPAPPPSARDNELKLKVVFEGGPAAHALPSPLWKPAKPTLPSELSITPMLHTSGSGKPIDDVTFETDLDGQLIATVFLQARQAAGVYAGMVVPEDSDVPLGILTIEVLK